jgi:hypothetical protein
MNYLNIRTICLQASFYSQFLAWVAGGPEGVSSPSLFGRGRIGKDTREAVASHEETGPTHLRGFRLNIV